jgi:hypothetical protein
MDCRVIFDSLSGEHPRPFGPSRWRLPYQMSFGHSLQRILLCSFPVRRPALLKRRKYPPKYAARAFVVQFSL